MGRNSYHLKLEPFFGADNDHYYLRLEISAKDRHCLRLYQSSDFNETTKASYFALLSGATDNRYKAQVNNMENLILQIRKELKNNVDKTKPANNQHFFKEEIKFYGVRAPIIRKISKDFFKLIDSKTKMEIFGLCDLLWKSGYMEESFIACHWSYYMHKKYEPKDFLTFEKWIDQYIQNWATCDTFCNHTVGSFLEMYPAYLSNLKDFAGSKNRWKRRAAAVSLIIPARKGMFLGDILEIADILLLDEDDLVQKGYGWMLKVASQLHEESVFEYVIRNKAVMPRTALRYAIEKMPKNLKTIAMAK